MCALVLAMSSCITLDDASEGCERDPRACPKSIKTASRVLCDCTCDLPEMPVPGGGKGGFKGKLAACLPSSLNADLATAAERTALAAMPAERFNQEVFRFCSREMADWLSLTVKSQVGRVAQVPAGLGCQPYRCKCGTKGARTTYAACAKPCAERPCDSDSCMSLLRQEGTIETDSCLCGRTEACGFVVPARDKAPLCRVLSFETVDSDDED